MAMRTGIWFVAATVAAAAAVVAGRPARGGDAPSSTSLGYLGPAACAPCHEAVHKAWGASWHAGSVHAVRATEFPKDALAGQPVRHGPGSTTFHREGERVVAETVGPDGSPHPYPVDYAVGGRRVTMLLTRLPEGRLQVLPAMRDESRGAWFDYTALIFGAPGLPHEKAPEVAPGDGSFWTGPVRSFEGRCARCHLAPTLDPRLGTSPVAVEPERLGLSCETCHGPGAAHVAFWKASPSSPAGDPIAGSKGLDPARSMDACLVCHLEGEVVAPGWSPGKPVLEHVDPTLLDDPDRVDAAGRPVELIYEGLQILASTCAIEGALRCTSCHDVHGTDRVAMLKADPRGTDLCAGCHAKQAADPRSHSRHDPQGSGALCVACHMPPVAVERGNGHVTDHTLGVPRPELTGAVAGRAIDACTGCHTGARGFPANVPRMAQERIVESYEAWFPRARRRPSWSAAIAAGRGAATPASRQAVEGLLAAPTAPEVVRASAARLLVRHGADAMPALKRALADPSS
ncbi:MAG TPA: cytochrome c3 family protein, partial [Planctomycetota bacterium]|nr:cytochrome c3 family protein [Planctomycetota bacterium]